MEQFREQFLVFTDSDDGKKIIVNARWVVQIRPRGEGSELLLKYAESYSVRVWVHVTETIDDLALRLDPPA